MAKTIPLTVVIPKGSPSRPGTYDTSNQTPKLNLDIYSSIFIKSISGGKATTNVSLITYLDKIMRATLPNMAVGDNLGNYKSKFSEAGFDRIVLSNPNDEAMTVVLMLGVDAIYKSTGSGGGGGVATHVSIDGTATIQGDVKVPDGIKVTGVVFPTTMATTLSGTPAVKIPSGVAVAVVNSSEKPIPIMGVEGKEVGVKGTVAVANTTATPIPIMGVVGKEVGIKGTVGLVAGTKVKLDGTITATTSPAAPNCLGVLNPVAGITPVKLLSARTKRNNVTVQNLASNLRDVLLLDPTAAHNIIGLIVPGTSYSFDYSGELWVKSDLDGQKLVVAETFNV